MTGYFDSIPRLAFDAEAEGPAFRHYDPDERVMGKRMEDHLRFAVAYWHSFGWEGGDPFGGRTFDRPWFPADTMALAEALSRLAAGQDRLVELARAQSDRPASAPPDMSGIEAALNRLARDLAEGRDEMVAELRSDLLVLTRAVRAARFNDPFRDDLLRDPLVLRDRS